MIAQKLTQMVKIVLELNSRPPPLSKDTLFFQIGVSVQKI